MPRRTTAGIRARVTWSSSARRAVTTLGARRVMPGVGWLRFMKRRLSSLQTFFMKIIFPALWIPLFGLGPLMMFLGGFESPEQPPKWIFLFFWLAGSAFIYWSCIRLKEVSVDDDFLYVSNYLKEIIIPLSEIYDVTENVWINIHPVTIRLKSPSEFGDKIVFMPTVRFFAFFSSHPVVSELKGMARSKHTGARFVR